jgi:hypothetical protein
MGGLRTLTGRAAPRAFATLAAVAALVASAWAPASASARFTDHEANVSVRVAHHFWHRLAPSVVERAGYNCGGRNVVLDWLRDLGSAMALADLWGCRQDNPTIQLERGTIRGLSDVGACGIITHEFGHLLGFAHSPRDRSVMSGSHSSGETPPRRATWQRAWRHCDRRV